MSDFDLNPPLVNRNDLIPGAVGLFNNLQWNLGRIFRDEHQRALPMQILMGLAMMLVLAALIVTSIVASFFFNVIGSEVVGGLGTLIALLTWTYLTGCLISLCGEIAVATDDWPAKRPPAVALNPTRVNTPVYDVPPEEKQQIVAPMRNIDRKSD